MHIKPIHNTINFLMMVCPVGKSIDGVVFKTKRMDKVIRNGKVAVLVSGGFGAGWSTWEGGDERLIFSPKLVEMVERGDAKLITTEWVEQELGIENVYCGGSDSLCIEWLDEGTPFYIDEYDGAESIVTSSNFTRTA